jgi:hypothetical protein
LVALGLQICQRGSILAATAAAYAVNIITVYDQYRWRFQQMQAANNDTPVNQWHGLQAPWDPKGGYLDSKQKELEFWL